MLLPTALATCRQMLFMPVESEVAAFSGSADTGARTAAAALVIQEAFRLYRLRQMVKVNACTCSYSVPTFGVVNGVAGSVEETVNVKPSARDCPFYE